MKPDRATQIIVDELRRCGHDVSEFARHIEATIDDVAMSERGAEREACAYAIERKFQEARDTEFDLGFETARKVFAAMVRNLPRVPNK